MHSSSVWSAERSGLKAAVVAELLKGRHAAPRKIALIAPLPFCALGILASGVLGGGGAGGTGFGTYGWNYWYVLLLPVSVALMAASVANQEGRHKFRTVLGLPLKPGCTWLAKCLYVLVLTFVANLVVSLVSGICAHVGGIAPAFVPSVLTALLVTIGCAWIIPASMFLTGSLGTLAGIAVPILAQVTLGIALSGTALWWAVPMTATVRLAAPVIGVAPSGIPLLPGDPMTVIDGAWWLSLLVATAFAVVLAVAGIWWFNRKEAL